MYSNAYGISGERVQNYGKNQKKSLKLRIGIHIGGG